MTIIRVVPESVEAYGREAQSIFDSMHTALVSMVNSVVEVRYFGPNAVRFKTEAGALAADFANKLHLDISAMAEAVRASTSAISGSLGGAPLTITVDSRPITAPTPETVDYLDVDTDALSGLAPTVSGHFTSLRSGLSSHLGKLSATDWHGNAKLTAVDAVSGYTSAAQGKCDTADSSIAAFINAQIDSVTTVDA